MTATIYLLVMGALLVPISVLGDPVNTQNTSTNTATTNSPNTTLHRYAEVSTPHPKDNGTITASTEVTTQHTSNISSTIETTKGISSNVSTKDVSTHKSTTPKSTTPESTTIQKTMSPNIEVPTGPREDLHTSQPPMTPKTASQPKEEFDMEKETKSNTVFVIIFVILIICVIVVICACYLQNKSRRRSVNIHRKSEDAQIPLAIVESDVFECNTSKDLKTFTAAEVSSSEPPENTEKTEGETAEAAESAEPVKESPAAEAEKVEAPAVEPSEIQVEMNDDESTISAKTSMETIEDPISENNNNNNKALQRKRGGDPFTEISLHD